MTFERLLALLHLPPLSNASSTIFQRFWTRLQANKQIVAFDRSWYGRVLVERVEGIATKREWRRAYGEINDFERILVDSGVRLVKLFLHITQDEQERRFRDRLFRSAQALEAVLTRISATARIGRITRRPSRT